MVKFCMNEKYYNVESIDKLIEVAKDDLQTFLDLFINEVHTYVWSNVTSRDKFLKTLKTITKLPEEDERFWLSIIWLVINTGVYYKNNDTAAIARVKDEFDSIITEYHIDFTWQNLMFLVKIVRFAHSKLKLKGVYKCCLKDAFKCCKKKKK